MTQRAPPAWFNGPAGPGWRSPRRLTRQTGGLPGIEDERRVRRHHLPAPLTLHPDIGGSIPAIDVDVLALHRDHEPVAGHGRLAVHHHPQIFLVVRAGDRLAGLAGALPQ